MAEDYDDRFSKGKASIQLFVHEIPASCKECPYYVKNINKDNLKDPAFYCLLRSSLASAQYAGTDITAPKEYMCPLKEFKESEEYEELDERITELEEKVNELNDIVQVLKGFHGV